MNKRESVAVYNPDEVKAMKALGYITPRQAADLSHVRIDRVYRAMKPRKVGGKMVDPQVRVKLGENEYNRYVHKADWLKLISAARTKMKQELGLG